MNTLPQIQPNSSAIAFLILVSAIGTLAIIMLLIRYSNHWQRKRTLKSRFSLKKFLALANQAGLDDNEKVLLENFFKNNPQIGYNGIFSNTRSAQDTLRQLYRSLYTNQDEHPDSDQLEISRSYIFHILQKLEKFIQKNSFSKSTREIPEGLRFYLEIPSQDATTETKQENNHHNPKFICKISKNQRYSFQILLLSEIKQDIPKNTKAKIEILKEGDQAIYESKILYYYKGNDNKNKDARHRNIVKLAHSNKKPDIIFGPRYYKRKNIRALATVMAMQKEGPHFRPASQSIPIDVLLCDISMTGCGLLSYSLIPIHSFIEITYINPYNNKKIKFIAQVMNHNTLDNMNIDAVILQNQIEKIDHENQNWISTFVYEFENEHDKIEQILKNKNAQESTFDSDTVAILRGQS